MAKRSPLTEGRVKFVKKGETKPRTNSTGPRKPTQAPPAPGPRKQPR